MTPVLVVPRRLDEAALDLLAVQAQAIGEAKRVVVDARQVQTADPMGLLGLLSLGDAVARGRRRPLLQLPRTRDGVDLFTRTGFGRVATEVFDLSAGDRARVGGEPGDVLLPITPVRTEEDVAEMVRSLHERAGPVLTRKLLFPESEIAAFAAVVSDLFCGVLARAGDRGWAAAQMHRRHQRVGRTALAVAVLDLGAGSPDAAAGLARVRAQVEEWGGVVAIRSGTTRTTDAAPAETGLAPLPGTQVLVVIPTQKPLAA